MYTKIITLTFFLLQIHIEEEQLLLCFNILHEFSLALSNFFMSLDKKLKTFYHPL